MELHKTPLFSIHINLFNDSTICNMLDICIYIYIYLTLMLLGNVILVKLEIK